jgi:hypothetical protein
LIPRSGRRSLFRINFRSLGRQESKSFFSIDRTAILQERHDVAFTTYSFWVMRRAELHVTNALSALDA